MGRKCRIGGGKSRNIGRGIRIFRRPMVSEELAHEAAALLPIERNRQMLAESGLQPFLDLGDDHLGDGRQVELAGFVEGDGDEVDEFRIRADDVLDLGGDGAGIDREETRVEALGPARRRDGAGDEGDGAEVGEDALAAKSAQTPPCGFSGAP